MIFKTKGATVHKAWFLYNLIGGHMLRLQNHLEQKDFGWRDQIVKALEKGLVKLVLYRGKATGQEALIYTLATVLDPATRLGQFQVSDQCLRVTLKGSAQLTKQNNRVEITRAPPDRSSTSTNPCLQTTTIFTTPTTKLQDQRL